MFLITTPQNTNEDTPAMAMVLHLTQDEDDRGLWVWFGFVNEGTYEHIVPGLIVRQWMLYTNDERDGQRHDLEVVKVNRVTVKFRSLQDGSDYTLRIDR